MDESIKALSLFQFIFCGGASLCVYVCVFVWSFGSSKFPTSLFHRLG